MGNSIEIIAEISANHGHNLSIAKDTIKAAKEAGADAVKIQTYTADTLTIDCDNEFFRIEHNTIWDGTTLYKLYQNAYTPWEWHEELFSYAKKIGIEIFSTPFDSSAVDLLEKLKVKRYKIASPEITDIPLIKYVASKGKPIIISVGIATYEDIVDAIQACKDLENDDITLLQCTSQYPAKVEDANLLVMKDLKERFQVKVGLSDHTEGHEVALVAAAMQVSIIEKHFIIDKNIGGPDASFSMDFQEFKDMVSAVRKVECILGHVSYEIDDLKRSSRDFARSLFVTKDVVKGELVSNENIRSIRPGYGLSPKYTDSIIGRKFTENIRRGTPLSWDLIENEL